MYDDDQIWTEQAFGPSDGVRRPDRSAPVIVIDGEIGSDTADWLELLAQSNLEGGADVVTIDCRGVAGPSGHLLGAIGRLARLADGYGATIGVIASGVTADAIHAHAPSLTVAPAIASLVRATGPVGELPIRVIGRTGERGGGARHLLWVQPRVTVAHGIGC